MPADETHGTDETYVVGLDGSPGSYAALDWAVRHAARTGARVHAVMAWQYVPEPWSPTMRPAVVTPEESEDAARHIVQLALMPYRDTGVELAGDVEHGAAWRVLTEVSGDAALLVVGSRGHGAVAGALLGSVAQRCTTHAGCPVVVIPHRVTTRDEREGVLGAPAVRRLDGRPTDGSPT
jgi:nucleotide-binding universal stress UspA family protein